jgi:flavin-binding protein dodecin
MSVYKIVEIVGTSPKSWEDATQKALATAAKSLEAASSGVRWLYDHCRLIW